MSILDNAKRHFEGLIDTVQCIDVPEWGDSPEKPAKICWRPMSLETNNKIFKFAADHSLEALAETLISRSIDESGNKIFRSADRLIIMKHLDPKIIERVCMAMGGSEDMTVEKAEKNS